MSKKRKRQKLGEGYIWFSDHSGVAGATGFAHVSLTTHQHGRGCFKELRIGNLGGWKKVRIIAEYTE